MLKEKNKNNQGVYILLLLLVVLIWGFAPNVSKILLNYFSPALKVACSALISFIAMLLISIKKLKKLNFQYFKIAVPTGIFYSAAYVMQQIGLKDTTPVMFTFLENLSCLIVPFLTWFMTRKRPSCFKFIAVGVCVLSVYILGGAKLDGSFGIGELLCGLAGLFYGVNMAVTGIKAKDLDSSLYLTIQFGINFIISLMYALIFEDGVFTVQFMPISILVGFTLISSVFGWLIRTICLKHIDATIVSVIMPFSSIITTIISIIMGTNVITWYLIVGAVLGLISALIANLNPEKFKKKNIEQNQAEKK